MKKILGLIAIIAVAFFLVAGIAKAAPTTTFFQSIAPTTNSTYNVGTSALKWLNAYFNQASTTDITISGKLFDSTGSAGTSGKFLKTSGTAATWTSLVSGDITTALGFTPFGGTNPLPVANGGTGATSFTSSNLLYGAGTNPVQTVGTSTLTASSPLTGSFTHVGTTGSLGCQVASGSQAGCLASADFTTFNNKQSALTFSTGLTNTGGTVTVNTSQNISALTNLTSNGLVKTSGGGGTLSIATAGTDYAPATSGSAILFGNGAGGFSNVTVSTGLSFTGGVLSATGGGGGGSGTVGTSSSETSGYFPPWTTTSGTPALLAGTSQLFQNSTDINIGTTTASGHQLDVANTAGAATEVITGNSTTVGSSLTISDLTTAGNQYSALLNPSGTANTNVNTIPLSATFSTGGGTTGGLIFDTKASTAPIVFYAGGNSLATNERLRITGAGLIGIASSTPTSLLSVGGNVFIGSATAGGTNGTLTVAGISTGLVKSTNGLFGSATAGTDYEVPLTFSTGLTRSTNTITVNTTQNITTLSNLSVAGFVQTTSGGVLSSAALTSGQVTTALGFTPFGGTNPLPVANGGTASTTAIVNGIKYFDPTGTFETASTSFVRLSNGNVGIGSTTPFSPLSVSTMNQLPATMPIFTIASTTGAAEMTVLANGFTGFNDSAPDAPITASLNTFNTALGAANTGTTIHTIGPDGAADRFTFDSTGAASVFTCRRGDTTAASPTALLAAENVCTFGLQGYTGTVYTSTKAQLNLLTTQNWSDTANGTAINFNTTANGSTVIREVGRFDQSGYLGVGTTTPGALLDLSTTSASTLPGGAFGQLMLSDMGAGTNLKHWLFGSDSGALTIGTTSDKFATGTPAVEIDKNGLFGIGTSTPSFQLSVQGKIYSATGGYVFPDGTVQTTAAAGGSNFFSNSGIFTSLSTGTNLGIGTTSPYSILSVLASFATTTSPFSVWGAASSTPQTLVQTFNSSGTWTKPAGNILSVKVQVVGSGGGGGASQSNSSSASGGSSSNFAAATPCIATGGGGGGSGTTGQLVPQGGDGGGGAGGGGTNNAVNAFGGGSGALETCTYTNATVGSSITVTVATGGPGSTGSGSFPSQGTGFQTGGSGGNPNSAGGAGGGSTGTPTGASTGGVTTNGNPGSTVTGVSGLGGGAAVLSTFGKGGNVTVSGGGSGNNGAVVVTVTFAAPSSPFPDFVLTPTTDASGNIQTQVGIGTSTPGALLTLQSNTSDDFLDLWTQISGTLVNFLQVDIYGHIVYHSDTLPTVTACGTSPSMGTPSSDEGGRIVVGSGTATSCTVTFAHPGPVGSVAYVNVWSVNGTLAANYQQSNTPDNTDFTFHSITNFASNQIGYEVTWVK